MKKAGLRVVLMVTLLLMLGALGFARAEGSPGISSTNLTPEQWVGQSFLFLTLPADKQSEGYEIFDEDQAKQGFQGDRSVRISYAEHVGRQVTVTNVVTYNAGDNQYEHLVYLKESDTGKKLIGRTMREQLEGLVLEADLMQAQQQFKGKTIYVKRRALEGIYNPNDRIIPMSIPTPIGGAVKVVDVYAGIQSREPIWLVALVNGQKAILPIAYSWTNMSVNAWKQSPAWQEALLMEDPRAQLGWSEALWDQIDAGVVQENMNKDQVRLSWGSPEFIEENACGLDTSIWNYGPKVLRFTGDKLSSIETVQ